MSQISLDLEPDVIYTNPGIPLASGNQRMFNKILVFLSQKPVRKSTISNLDRVRFIIAEIFDFASSDSMIWNSIRSTNIRRPARNFIWKAMHEAFHVGLFWDHVQHLEHLGLCSECRLPETMEHILLECAFPGQQIIWTLTKRLWNMRWSEWPKLTLGLLLGCALTKYRTLRGSQHHSRNRFFAIIASTSMYLIWNIRNERVLGGRTHTETEIHNRWVALLNSALKRHQLLTDKIRFGSLSRKRQLVLETWRGVLHNEDALPEDWINCKGVLVGIRPDTQNSGIG
ncbi:hypothetical protein R3P38DRAFT_3329613 [Favolaschia claudopus]|uniref:Reverse transcriptase zinc-binding domain-containing protein n=1 Tax=Favolaschia claudopus TaxID=2862362 RepID=A0AAV9ZYZ3_9AGAR